MISWTDVEYIRHGEFPSLPSARSLLIQTILGDRKPERKAAAGLRVNVAKAGHFQSGYRLPDMLFARCLVSFLIRDVGVGYTLPEPHFTKPPD